MWSSHAAYVPGLPIPTILYSSLSDPQLCVGHAPFHASFLKRSFLVSYELYRYFPLHSFCLCFFIFFSFNLAFWLCPFLCHLHCSTCLIISLQRPLLAVGKEHTQLAQDLPTIVFPLLACCISKSLSVLSALGSQDWLLYIDHLAKAAIVSKKVLSVSTHLSIHNWLSRKQLKNAIPCSAKPFLQRLPALPALPNSRAGSRLDLPTSDHFTVTTYFNAFKVKSA